MSDIQQLCNELQLHLDMVKSELSDLDSGKKSAGPRARKSLQTIKATSQRLRGDIIQKTKSIPTRPRIRKAPPVDIEDLMPDEPPVLERQETNSIEELVEEPPMKKKTSRKQRATKK